MKPQTMQRNYVREATAMLVLARLAVRFLPASRLFTWADRTPRRISRFAAEDATWIAWAVERAGTHRWINALCLPRALAAHAMLRRRGIPSRLCLGVARCGDEIFAHAWIEVGEQIVVGGHEARSFTPLAAYGAK